MDFDKNEDKKVKKKALITGASRGIGAEIASVFAKNGYDLVVTCRSNLEKLQNIAIDLSSRYNIECKAVLCDMGDAKSVEKLISDMESVDVVVNNAGVSHVGLLQDISIEDWDGIMSTNMNSVFYTCKFVIPKMLPQQSGSIINISSMWGRVGASCEVAYSASKGGVIAFTKALAKELAPSNIRVNCVAPGVIDTDMNKCFSKEDMENLCEEIPMGRLGSAKEVADLVYQLANAPEYMTGQVIGIDGGYI